MIKYICLNFWVSDMVVPLKLVGSSGFYEPHQEVIKIEKQST